MMRKPQCSLAQLVLADSSGPAKLCFIFNKLKKSSKRSTIEMIEIETRKVAYANFSAGHF